MTRCRYCGGANYGQSCQNSPTRIHEHTGTAEMWELCGGRNYGRSCQHSPTRIHRHGSDGKRLSLVRWDELGNRVPALAHENPRAIAVSQTDASLARYAARRKRFRNSRCEPHNALSRLERNSWTKEGLEVAARLRRELVGTGGPDRGDSLEHASHEGRLVPLSAKGHGSEVW